MKTILDLSHSEARSYFMCSKNYCNIELPIYFSFEKLLSDISTYLVDSNLSQFTSSELKPYELDDVNYSLLNNKNDSLSWRPLKIIHPVFYVHIVNLLTSEQNWIYITERFKKFQCNENIICYSYPMPTDEFLMKETNLQITNWWLNIEQQSLQLSLEYSNIVHTDITNCYGSIYTHAVAWALHDKDFCKLKENKNNKNLLGNKLDKSLTSMSFGQTNGIPQGSNLMDFIAELVLGYADYKLSKKIKDTEINEYKVLRYRDDYRIFTQSETHSKHLTKLLAETLFELGMSLNSQKTSVSQDLIKSALKKDKWFWIKHKQGNRKIQDHLLLIYELAEEYPNSGTLKKALVSFHKRLSGKDIHLADFKVLISITTAIMVKNPSVYAICTAILSILFEFLGSPDEVENTLELIRKKFTNIPNTGHLEIWLQRMTLKYNFKIDYSEKLTKKVLDHNIQLWNSDWISNNALRELVNSTPIVLEEEVLSVEKIISHKEMKIYFTLSTYSAEDEEEDLEDYEPAY